METNTAPDVKEDKAYVTRHSAIKGFQAFSLLTPPAYVALTLYRHGRGGFKVNNFLRATWIGGLVGAGTGGVLGEMRLKSQSPESIHDRRMRLMYNQSQIRVDDYSAIGAGLYALLTPALFWNRARAVHLILGGVGLGSDAGVLVHLFRSLFEGSDIRPEGMADVLQDEPKKSEV